MKPHTFVIDQSPFITSNAERIIPIMGGDACSMAGGHQIYEEPHRSGHSDRQLAKERIAAVNVCPLSVGCDQQTSLEWFFAWIMRREQRSVALIPIAHKVQPALLHPSLEIFGCDGIGILQDLISRSKYLNRSLFDADALAT